MTRKTSFLKNHAREFCNKTSLHGLRYVSESGAHWLQSLIWLALIGLCVIFCSILMLLIWNRFQNDPTITAVETINYPIWKVPFPAVTICNPNKVYEPNIAKIENIMILNNVPEDKTISFFNMLSNLVVLQTSTENFTDVFDILRKNNYNAETIMLEIMQPCSNLLQRCTWMGEIIHCNELFKTIKTDEGFCCTFNYHHTQETFDGPEVSSKTEYKEKVIHIAGAGIHTGLSVVINVEDEHWLSATRLVPSVLVYIHNSLDYAEMKILSTLVEKGELVQMPIDPSVIDTTNDVKSLHFTKRNCIFEEERYLSIGAYGYENCIIECRMNAIVDLCKCIPFYFNVKNYTYMKDIRFCEIADSQCLNNNQRKLYTLYNPDIEKSDDVSKMGLKCDCLPTCDVNWYSYTSDIGKMSGNMFGYNTDNIIALHVYFSDFNCMKYRQSNLITWDGLFASFGGIFGLCLGGSILSILEVFYHFTIKLYIAYKLRNNNVKSVKVAKNNFNKHNKFNVNINHGGLTLHPNALTNDLFLIGKYKRKHNNFMY